MICLHDVLHRAKIKYKVRAEAEVPGLLKPNIRSKLALTVHQRMLRPPTGDPPVNTLALTVVHIFCTPIKPPSTSACHMAWLLAALLSCLRICGQGNQSENRSLKHSACATGP